MIFRSNNCGHRFRLQVAVLIDDHPPGHGLLDESLVLVDMLCPNCEYEAWEANQEEGR